MFKNKTDAPKEEPKIADTGSSAKPASGFNPEPVRRPPGFGLSSILPSAGREPEPPRRPAPAWMSAGNIFGAQAQQPAAPAQEAAEAAKPAAEPMQPVQTQKASQDMNTANFATASDSAKRDDIRKLVVGKEISLSGEIGACDHLVVEGTVEAKLKDARSIEIASTGAFRGKVKIESAEISGSFEGELAVSGRLTIRSTGLVKGKVKCGELAVDLGGKLLGEITVGDADAGKLDLADEKDAKGKKAKDEAMMPVGTGNGRADHQLSLGANG
jgi:cytoskeletal protein CcmA (bactofilin family)